jgi:hypothetical protein
MAELIMFWLVAVSKLYRSNIKMTDVSIKD